LSAVLVMSATPILRADDIRLQLYATKTDVLVGEAVVITVGIETTLPVEVQPDLTLESPPLKVLIDHGQGFIPYREWTSAIGQRDPGKHPPRGGRMLIEYILAYDARTQSWVFPKPGAYGIVVEYRDGALTARSNVVTMNASDPGGDEKEVRDAILEWGEQSLAFHVPNRLGLAGRDLLQRFPTSVYLQELRLNDLNSRLSSIGNGFDPDEPPSAGDDSNPPTRPNFRPEVQRQWLTAVLPDAQDAAGVPGPFQPDALILLAGIYESLGDEVSARALYERVAREFPDRKAAEFAQERVGDSTPPELLVSASPSALWPPSHRLEPISVAVQVQDDQDPEPIVKLVLVTCDDGCNPAQDVAGADIGTDDRQFALRSERRGSGQGRTYTITYSAQDASGNETTATTIVAVPHNQGSK